MPSTRFEKYVFLIFGFSVDSNLGSTTFDVPLPHTTRDEYLYQLFL